MSDTIAITIKYIECMVCLESSNPFTYSCCKQSLVCKACVKKHGKTCMFCRSKFDLTYTYKTNNIVTVETENLIKQYRIWLGHNKVKSTKSQQLYCNFLNQILTKTNNTFNLKSLIIIRDNVCINKNTTSYYNKVILFYASISFPSD